MGLITWVIVGAIAGWLASEIVRGSGLGLIGNILLGVVGGILGGWLAGRFLNIPNAISGFNLTTFITAFLGSAIILFIVRLFKH